MTTFILCTLETNTKCCQNFIKLKIIYFVCTCYWIMKLFSWMGKASHSITKVRPSIVWFMIMKFVKYVTMDWGWMNARHISEEYEKKLMSFFNLLTKLKVYQWDIILSLCSLYKSNKSWFGENTLSQVLLWYNKELYNMDLAQRNIRHSYYVKNNKYFLEHDTWCWWRKFWK